MTREAVLFGIEGDDETARRGLMANLVERASQQGLRVSALVETDADFDVDRVGKDSHEHRRAGAREVVMASSRRWAKMHERRNDQAMSVEAILANSLGAMDQADLILVEGFAAAAMRRLRVLEAPVDSDNDRDGDRAGERAGERIVAWVLAGGAGMSSDDPRPCFDLADLDGILDFMRCDAQPGKG